MHIAAHENAEEGLVALLEAGANHHATDMQGETPLYHAASADSARTVEMLIDADASPNARNRFGQIPRALAPADGESRPLLIR